MKQTNRFGRVVKEEGEELTKSEVKVRAYHGRELGENDEHRDG
jgi:hypothetical protein